MLFRPATTAFDAVIRLNPKMVAKRHMNLDAKTSGKPAEILPLEKVDTIPLVGFEPVSLYIEELKVKSNLFSSQLLTALQTIGASSSGTELFLFQL